MPAHPGGFAKAELGPVQYVKDVDEEGRVERTVRERKVVGVPPHKIRETLCRRTSEHSAGGIHPNYPEAPVDERTGDPAGSDTHL